MSVNNERGVSFVEVAIASAIGLVILIGLTSMSGILKSQTASFTDVVDCEEVAANLQTALRTAQEKPEIVSWAPQHPADNKRADDTLDYFEAGTPDRIATENVYVHQNVKDASNWAFQAYNRWAPEICLGKVLQGPELDRMLAALEFQRPPGLQEMKLKIGIESSVFPHHCGKGKYEPLAQSQTRYNIGIELKMTTGKSCGAVFSAKRPEDDKPPEPSASFVNGAERLMSFGNSCTRTCAPPQVVDSEYLPFNDCAERATVTIHFSAAEPGSIFFCRFAGKAWKDDPPENWRLCQYLGTPVPPPADLPPGSIVTRLTNLADTAEAPYEIDVLAIDPDNNRKILRTGFATYVPSCPGSGCPSNFRLWAIRGGLICLPPNETPSCLETTCPDAHVVKQ